MAINMWRARLGGSVAALVGFPDGAEIINRTAAVGMAGVMVPCGAGLLQESPAAESRAS